VRQAGEQNRVGDPTSGLAKTPMTAVTTVLPQQAQMKVSRTGSGKASRNRDGGSGAVGALSRRRRQSATRQGGQQ